MQSTRRSPSLHRPAMLVAVLALVIFALVTPDGLLTKLDLVGYAVCHRISSRSFFIAERQLPLCARCTGTFIGALVGLFGQGVVLRRRRAAGFPPFPVVVLLVGFVLLWAFDGLNSYMTLVQGPHLYEPRNWLRLSSGALQGLAISALVYPVFNLTLWRNPSEQRAISSLGDLGVLLLMEGGLVGLVLTGHRLLLYPLALLSAAGVLTLLSIVNAMLVVLLAHRENSTDSWKDAAVALSIGFVVSVVQVGIIDLVRYSLTGTLQGIPPLR